MIRDALSFRDGGDGHTLDVFEHGAGFRFLLTTKAGRCAYLSSLYAEREVCARAAVACFPRATCCAPTPIAKCGTLGPRELHL